MSPKKCNPDPCCSQNKIKRSDSADLDHKKSISAITEHSLKVSTTMQGVISDSDQAERIRELIKKLKE